MTVNQEKLYRREKYLSKIRAFYDDSDLIKVITGIRRCGKSSLMRTIIDELKERSNPVAESNIIYINLDKREYRNVKTADQLDSLIEKLTNASGLKYVFLDEIQNVKGFEEVVNDFREEGEYSIFITGSNSYLLSGELATKLTGRYLEFEMFPLTFDEYEDFKKFYDQPVDSDISKELNNYILEGGFPRTIAIDNMSDKRTYVSNVIKEIFDKDIKTRVKIKDTQAFEAVRNYIINNFGATTSINSLCESLKKNGLAISRTTLARYIRVLLDAKIIYECPRFDMKSKRALSGEKKYYLADLSFYYALNTDNRINYGPTLENIVYLYAKSFGYSVSVGRIGKLECDFILRNADMDYAYAQVAYTILLSRETEDREYRALEAIHDNYEKYVMTMDSLIQKRNGVKHVNIADFIKNKQIF
ncbi:ATP-binding protein [Bifidobacterium sp. UMB1197]|nr:ATP-binding protein [Bifidobacterium sp. UMB1197]